MIYLASPYSDPDPDVRERRYQEACRAAARLMQDGDVVFSPIAHGHAIAANGLPHRWSFWKRFDIEHLRRCDEVVVLMIDGWQQSEGVRDEVQIAEKLGKPVRYWRPTWAPGLAGVAKERVDG